MIILRNSEEANIFHFFLKFSFFFIKIISALLLESFQIVLKTVDRSLEKEKSLFLVQMCYWFQDQVKKKKKIHWYNSSRRFTMYKYAKFINKYNLLFSSNYDLCCFSSFVHEINTNIKLVTEWCYIRYLYSSFVDDPLCSVHSSVSVGSNNKKQCLM